MQADAPEGISPPVRRPRTGPSLLAPGAVRDPHRLYRVLRETHPLCYDALLGAWLVSRYADVVTALTDPRFTGLPHDAAPRGGPAPLGLCHGGPRCATPRPPGPATPPHPAVARTERTAYVLARRIAGRQQADLVEEFCRWLPVGAIAGTSATPSAGATAGAGVHRYPDPPDHSPCTRHTALRTIALASFLANLLDAPDLLAALRTEPSLADRAWTESLRRDPPVQLVLRRTTHEVTLSGGTLPAGAYVACLTGSAGRDPGRFAAPDLFDPLRTDQGHSLTGPASCPAVLLGRLEARHGPRALLDAMPDLRWADGFRPARTGLLTRGPRTLLVRPG
ncbi:cytochrome P450 [Streptomyces sp. NPDC056347]|uniref:cytochrome P450 n=1 Tax=Streptomyces sp. NPDC056347 TaxID=3345790 RepID=UPI0035DD6265